MVAVLARAAYNLRTPRFFLLAEEPLMPVISRADFSLARFVFVRAPCPPLLRAVRRRVLIAAETGGPETSARPFRPLLDIVTKLLAEWRRCVDEWAAHGWKRAAGALAQYKHKNCRPYYVKLANEKLTRSCNLWACPWCSGRRMAGALSVLGYSDFDRRREVFEGAAAIYVRNQFVPVVGATTENVKGSLRGLLSLCRGLAGSDGVAASWSSCCVSPDVQDGEEVLKLQGSSLCVVDKDAELPLRPAGWQLHKFSSASDHELVESAFRLFGFRRAFLTASPEACVLALEATSKERLSFSSGRFYGKERARHSLRDLCDYDHDHAAAEPEDS